MIRVRDLTTGNVTIVTNERRIRIRAMAIKKFAEKKGLPTKPIEWYIEYSKKLEWGNTRSK